MTAHEVSNEPRSRRALLAGLLGGVGVWAAATVSQAGSALAAAGDPIRMGRLNKASGTSTELQTSTSKPAFWARQLGGGHAVRAEAETGRAVMATTGKDGTAVWAFSPDHYGVFAHSPNGVAVQANSVRGTAVAAESEHGSALRGMSTYGAGVYGRSLNNYAGEFDGAHPLSRVPRHGRIRRPFPTAGRYGTHLRARHRLGY